MDKAREGRIKKICAAVNSGQFGGANKDALQYFGGGVDRRVRRFSSGHPSIDDALGGGWPIGRVIEVYGPESGGKTTACLHAVAEHQMAFPDEDIAFIDVEHSLDQEYAEALGVDLEPLMICQPESGEQAVNVLRQLIALGVKLIVVDSVAALTTTNEMGGDIGDDHMAERARLMNRTLRMITADAGKRGCTVFFTNQIYEKIGVTYGEKTTTPGGRALKFYASVRAEIRRIGSEKESAADDADVVGAKTKFTVKKNKTAPPFRVATITLTFGVGFDRVIGVLDAAVDAKVVQKRGSWFSFGDEQIGRASCRERV